MGGRKFETWNPSLELKCNDFRISTQPYTSKKDQNPRVHQVRLADPPGSPAPPVPAAQGTKARSFNSPSVPQAWLDKFLNHQQYLGLYPVLSRDF